LTNVPQPAFGPNGFIAPARSAIFAGRMADFQAAFGGNLNDDPTTPQGQIVTSDAAIIGASYDLFCKITSQFDPQYAEGRAQDALGRIYFLERDPAEPTVVQATCSGATGTLIPVGSLARSADGDTFVSTAAGTIGAGGTVDIPFASVTAGPIALPPASLTTIFRAITGWDSITNASEGVLGRLVESRDAFEQRRAASVALNATGVLPSIRATVLNVPGVLDAYVTENPTAAPVTIGGVVIAARSLFVSVIGGALADIALAIWRKKAPGCGYTGTTTVTVEDDNSGYSIPYPIYDVTFTVPAALPIKFLVTLATSVSVPADAEALIQAAIISAFAGNDGGPRAKIGTTVYASRFYSTVAMLGPWAQIISIKVGTGGGTPALDDVVVHIDQVPSTAAPDISVVLA
jgi:uncharacterized phage protein gp47/JayE